MEDIENLMFEFEDVEFTDEEVQMMLAANPYVLPLEFEQVLDTGEEQEYTDNKPL